MFNNGKFYNIKGPNGIVGLLLLVLLIIGLYFVAKGVYWVLSFVAPILFIATLFINYNVVADYGKGILKNIKTNPLFGIASLVLSLIFLPVVIFFLFGKAMTIKKIQKLQTEAKQRYEEQFVPYEEVPDWSYKKNRPEDNLLDLPPINNIPKKEEPIIIEQPKNKEKPKESNPYDSLFEE